MPHVLDDPLRPALMPRSSGNTTPGSNRTIRFCEKVMSVGRLPQYVPAFSEVPSCLSVARS